MRDPEQRKAYYEANKSKWVEYRKNYKAAHPERVKAQKKRYRETHREQIAAYMKEYMKTHPAPKSPRKAKSPESVFSTGGTSYAARVYTEDEAYIYDLFFKKY